MEDKRGMRKRASKPASVIPKDAVLLTPEPEKPHESSPYGIKPGYYAAKQMLELVNKHKSNARAIQFIADMLETGDAENDGFAEMLRTNRQNPAALARLVKQSVG